MYKPLFNTLLVEVSKDKWGSGIDESMLGTDYREGTVRDVTSILVETKDYPSIDDTLVQTILDLKGKEIMWNQGHEAGTVFEEDGKMYCCVYWWDIRGVK